MTTESARGSDLVKGAPAVLLIAGALLELFAMTTPVAPPVILLAVAITLRFPRNGLTLVTAAVGTVVLLAPALVRLAFGPDAPSGNVLPLVQAAWIVAMWLVAALRLNDRRAAQIDIDQLAHAFEHAPAATAVVGRDGRVLHANQAFADLLGRPLPALPGGTLDDFLGETAWSAIRDDSRALLSGEVGHVSLERAFVRGDGRALWVSIYARLMKDAIGRPAYVILQAIDLSEQRLAQRALAISESRFRGIIENSGELVLVIDANGAITYANPAVARLANRKASALIGTRVTDLVHTADRKALEMLIASARKQPRKGVSHRQLRLAHDEGTFLEVYLTALDDTPGIEGTVLSGRVITEQVHAERAVRVSESKFSTIFHSSPDAIMILRAEDSAIIDFNDGFTLLLGYTREESIGEPELSLNIFDDPKDRDRVLEVLTRDKQCNYQTRLVAKGGEVLDTEISLRYIEIQGELCVLCIGRDVTARRKAEQALKESEEKFARIFANSPDGIVIVGLADGTVLDINEAFIRSSGYAYDEIVGRTLGELSVFADRAELDRAAEVTARSPGGSHLELTFVTKTGVKVPTLISTSVVELGGEKSLLCIAKDIRTQRDTEEKLRASEARFRSAFENAPMGMLLVQLDGSVFQANRFALEALGYPEDELKGMHVARLLPANQRAHLKNIFGSLRDPNSSTGQAEERPMLCRNGEEIWTNFHVVLQRSASGQPLYFIIQITDITEMRHNREQVERMAYYDTLTDLANRRLFSLRLEQAINHAVRSESFAALLYLDVDQFKRVNDTLGHEAGDELLCEVGRRLTDCVRREDTVARLGGDEFAILLFDVRHPGDAGMVAEKILERIRHPLTIAGHGLVVTASIGVTIVPTDSTEPNVLTKNADLAMYRAKDRGRNNFQFYAEEMNTRAVARLKTENELRQGLDAGQFELYYQPKVRLSDNRILGIECLLRWHHPERGFLTPDKFIDIAEESGVIIELGAWVVTEACRATERLSRETGLPLEVAVNISPRQFRDPQLVATIRRSLREARLKPFQLELEITETMLMSDREAAETTAHKLHELGVKLAIDDFGTGYSQLNYLKRFPISTVKVDRSFVMDIPSNTDDMAITAAVIAMAHRMNLEVVAEGIETPAQLSFLVEHRCEYGQGYYFSKPVTFEGVQQLIEANRAEAAPTRPPKSPSPQSPTKARLRPRT